MQVSVISYTTSDPSREEFVLDIPAKTTVQTLLELANLPIDRLIIVNRVVVDLNHILEEGDEIQVFPLIAGG